MSGVKKFIPLLDRILVEKITNTAKQTSGGIFIPTSNTTNNNSAKIISVGTGPRRSDGSFVEPIVREGDIVIINSKATPSLIPWGDKTYHLINENDILGVIEH